MKQPRKKFAQLELTPHTRPVLSEEIERSEAPNLFAELKVEPKPQELPAPLYGQPGAPNGNWARQQKRITSYQPVRMFSCRSVGAFLWFVALSWSGMLGTWVLAPIVIREGIMDHAFARTIALGFVIWNLIGAAIFCRIPPARTFSKDRNTVVVLFGVTTFFGPFMLPGLLFCIAAQFGIHLSTFFH